MPQRPKVWCADPEHALDLLVGSDLEFADETVVAYHLMFQRLHEFYRLLFVTLGEFAD